MNKLQAENERLQAEISKLQAEFSKLQAEKERLQAEISKLQGQIPQLQTSKQFDSASFVKQYKQQLISKLKAGAEALDKILKNLVDITITTHNTKALLQEIDQRAVALKLVYKKCKEEYSLIRNKQVTISCGKSYECQAEFFKLDTYFHNKLYWENFLQDMENWASKMDQERKQAGILIEEHSKTEKVDELIVRRIQEFKCDEKDGQKLAGQIYELSEIVYSIVRFSKDL